MRFHAQGPIATINVGKEGKQKTFYTHINLLKEKSDYFRAALSLNFQEGIIQQVDLPEHNSHSFGFFVEWAYQGTFESCCSAELIDVWILADKLMAPKLQNDAIDRLKARNRRRPVLFPLMEQVLKQDVDGTLLMEYLIDELAWCFNKNAVNLEKARVNKGFQELKFDIMFRIMSRMRFYGNASIADKVRPSETPAPKYHVTVLEAAA